MAYSATLSRRVGRACRHSPLADLSWDERVELAERLDVAGSFAKLSEQDQRLIVRSEKSK